MKATRTNMMEVAKPRRTYFTRKMKRSLLLCTAALGISIGSIPFSAPYAQAAESSVLLPDYNIYYGIPHAHTGYSDGSKDTTPQDAFAYAKSKGLDYLFITDHSNMFDGVTDDKKEYVSERNEFVGIPDSEWSNTKEMAEAASSDSFTAFRGFEMTYQTTGGNYGHINVFNTDTYVEAAKQMPELSDFYSWLAKQNGALAMFNHPNRPITAFESLQYNAEADGVFQLLEVSNGSLGSNFVDTESYYYKALDYGWHLAPASSQDNHAVNWGDTDNLTAIVARSNDAASLLEAIQERRVYSTETRNLKLDVLANGLPMGSQLDASSGDEIQFSIHAEDLDDPIKEVQIITNNGVVLTRNTLPEASTSVNWNPTVTAATGQNWYVVKVIHANDRMGLASAVYTQPAEYDVKLINFTVDPAMSTANYDTTISVEVANAGSHDLTEPATVSLYVGAPEDNQLIGAATINQLVSGHKQSVSVKWTPIIAGVHTITAVLTPIAGVTTKTTLQKDVEVRDTNGKTVMIDNSHRNIGVSNGTMAELTELLRFMGYIVEINEQPITDSLLDSVNVFIYNTPSSVTYQLTADEQQSLANWVREGGSLMVSTQSTDQSKYNTTFSNGLLADIGTDIRFNYDSIREALVENQDNKNVQSFYARAFPKTADGINDDMAAIRVYRGASLVNADNQALVNDDSKQLDILLTANASSYNANVLGDGYVYSTEEDLNGELIPIVARQTIDQGKLVVSGRYAYSNYEIANDASNAAFYLNIIDYLADYSRVTPISSLKASLANRTISEGDLVSVEGILLRDTEETSHDNEWHDVYLSDGTGTVSIQGNELASKEYTAGTKLSVHGKVSLVDNELVVTYDSFDYDVLYIGDGSKYLDEYLNPSNPNPSNPNPPYPSGSGNSTSTPESSDHVVELIVNGVKLGQLATASEGNIGDQAATIISVDNDKVIDMLKEEEISVLTISVNETSDVVVGEFNGKLINELMNKDVIIELKTDLATYRIPASQIKLDSLALLGSNVNLEDITIHIQIGASTDSINRIVTEAAVSNGYSVVGLPVDFEITIEYGNQRVNMNQFDSYVARSIAIPNGVDASQITTAVVLHADGSLSHIPTRIVTIDGTHFAVINSLTNSTYALVSNSKTFSDVENHWSAKDVSDMASRLIIQGVNDHEFQPNKAITRAEFVSIIVRALGMKSKANVEAPKDVRASDWFADTVTTAISYDLVNGYGDGTFHPNQKITRNEAAVIVARALTIVNLDTQLSANEVTQYLSSYKDASTVATWADKEVAAAIKYNILQGNNGKLLAGDDVSRAETAAMVRRLLQKAEFINS